GRRVAGNQIFVATGRRPNTRDAEPERAGVELANGAGAVNARLETTARGIWAAGDVTGGLLFTHVADYMAKIVVRNALTPFPAKADYRVVPWVTFTDPEVARVGLTAAEAEARGERVATFRASFSELDRAIVDGATVGFSKVVTRPNGRILRATIVGRGAGELIMELALGWLTPRGIEQLLAALREPWWAPLAFVAAYTIAAALDFSGLVLTLVGGAVFGFWWGALLNLLGANLGASAAFWVARLLGREGLHALLGDRLSAGLDRLAHQAGFAWLLRLRLIPIVPFNLRNFASGLTALPWRTYAAATAI